MEGGDIGSEALRSSNWEVYKDAFAPPPPGRRVKPWERAAVSAHAPRLQGQKVWKKVNPRQQLKEDDAVSHEAAQAELEKAGTGARKRARILGGKENIGNAPWKKGILNGDELVNGMPSPKKHRLSMVASDTDAFVVPRKRTNANHLITPRKPTRMPLLEQRQAATSLQISPKQVILESADNQAQTQDSIKSPAKLFQRIPLNDLEQNEESIAPASEKPVRRRKSLRRSSRRVTIGTTSEQPPPAPSEGAITTEVSESSPNTFEAQLPEAGTFQPVLDFGSLQTMDISITLSEEADVPTVLQEFQSINTIGDPASGAQQSSFFAEVPPTTPKAEDKHTLETSTVTSEVEKPSTIDLQPAIDVREGTTPATYQTPQDPGPVLESVELDVDFHSVSPTKVTGTPRSRRKTPQRRGSRRSTRSTRATSTPPEESKLPDNEPQERGAVSSSPRKHAAPELSAVDNIEAATASSETNHMQVVDSDHSLQTEPATEIVPATPTPESRDITGISATPLPDSPHKQVTEAALEPMVEDLTSGTQHTVVSSPEKETVVQVTTSDDGPGVSGTSANTVQDNCVDEAPSAASGTLPSEDTIQLDFDFAQSVQREASVESFEILDPISISTPPATSLEDLSEDHSEDLPGMFTPNPCTTKLVETNSANAPANTFDQDDTDMLRNFLTRVKANKAAKADSAIPRRKRSLPHSPIQLPLGSNSNFSPTSPKSKDEFDVSLPEKSSSKRKRDDAYLAEDDVTEPKSIRRSGRTRLPVKAAPVAAPSFIPVRRLGQDGDNTVTLKKNEEKELAALTRVNTRKNKAGALGPLQVLAKQAEDKEDPASRQRALKEVFDDKVQKQKKAKKAKTVIWAEELVHFQTEEVKNSELERAPEKEKEKSIPAEEKKNAVKVGVRSKMTLGMVANGTPAPKRKMRGRS